MQIIPPAIMGLRTYSQRTQSILFLTQLAPFSGLRTLSTYRPAPKEAYICTPYMVAEREMGRDGMQQPSRKQGETAEQQNKTIPLPVGLLVTGNGHKVRIDCLLCAV